MILADTFDLDIILNFLNSYGGYIRYIVGALMVLLDIVVIVGALIYMGLGFAFGTRKSLRRFLTFAVPFTLLLILINPISSLIVNTTFNLVTSEYSEIAINYLEEMSASYGVEVDINLDSFYHTLQLIKGTSYTIIRLVLFVIGLLLIVLIITPLTRFTTWLTFRVQMNGKKEMKIPLASRFGGMAIASIRYIFVLILLVMPIHGVISSISLLMSDAASVLEIEKSNEVKTSETLDTTTEILNVVSDILKEISEGSKYSLTRQFFKKSAVNGVSADMNYLGQFTEVKVEDTTLNIFNEYGTIRRLFPIANKAINVVFQEKTDPIEIIKYFETEDVDDIKYVLKNLQIIKISLPIGFETTCITLEQVEKIGIVGIDISQIKEIDINKDYDLLIDAVSIIVKAVVAQNFEFETNAELIDNIINNEVLDKELKTFITDILETDIVTKVALPLGVQYINEGFEQLNMPEFDELQALFTQEKIEACLKNDIADVIDVARTIYNSELKVVFVSLINGEEINAEEIDFSSPEFRKDITNSVEKLMNLTIVKNTEEILIKALLSAVIEGEINIDDILYDENGNKLINWSEETKLLVDAIFEILDIVGLNEENFTVEALQEKLISNVEAREKLIDIVAKSDIVRYLILVKTPEIMKDSGSIPEEFFDFFTTEKFEALNDEVKFANEFKLLMGLLDNILNLGILDFETFELNKENQEAIERLIKDLLNSHFILGDEEKLIKLFIEATNFSTILAENGIVLDYSAVTDWHVEIERILDIAIGFLDISTSEDFDLSNLFSANMHEEEIEKVANLFEKVAESELFNPIIYQLIDNVGYEIAITDEDKIKIEENGWKNEITSLLSIIGDAQSLLEEVDLTTLEGSQVEELMLEASNGIITSKVFGTILSEALGPNGLNINTIDENGNPKYDFTDPEVLKAEAKNIANLIDLANGLSNVDLENADSVAVITDALANLENNELAQDFVKEIVGEDVDLEEVSNDADIIKNIYEEYQQSDDKDNFTLDPESELAAQLEDSKLAKAILEMMGIL